MITVSLASELSGLGCGPAPGPAGCNTSFPWRAVPNRAMPGLHGRRTGKPAAQVLANLGELPCYP